VLRSDGVRSVELRSRLHLVDGWFNPDWRLTPS
jgi:hypothetical protein